MRDWEKDLAETEAFRQGRALGRRIIGFRTDVERARETTTTKPLPLEALYVKRRGRKAKGRPGFEDIYDHDPPGAA